MQATSSTRISTISSSTTRLILFYCGGEGIGTLPRPASSLLVLEMWAVRSPQHLLPGSDAQLFCSTTVDGTSTRKGFTFRTHCIAPCMDGSHQQALSEGLHVFLAAPSTVSGSVRQTTAR
ncbi:unnamed protein product [Boreogadus saida]